MTHSDHDTDILSGASKRPGAKIKPQAVYNLHSYLEHLRNKMHHLAQTKHIELSLGIEENLPVAFFDVDSLCSQVFNKLLSNALINTQAGGRIALRAEKSSDYTMTFRISASNKYPSERRNVFFRSSESDNEEMQNALGCIAAHRGTIEISHNPKFSSADCKIEIPLYALCMQ